MFTSCSYRIKIRRYHCSPCWILSFIAFISVTTRTVLFSLAFVPASTLNEVGCMVGSLKPCSYIADRRVSLMKVLSERIESDSSLRFNATNESESESESEGLAVCSGSVHRIGSVKKRSRVNSFVLVQDIESLARKSKDRKAGEKAEGILDRMIDQYQIGNAQCKPTAMAYSTVINVWAKQGNPRKAEDVLHRLEKAYELTGDLELKPNTFSYNAVLDAWARSSRRGAAEQAQKLLDNMIDMHKDGNVDVMPNAISFNTVLNAWSKSSADVPTAAEKAEELLQRMEELRRISYSDVRPTTISFSSVITAWARSGLDHATERADYILERMMELSKTNKEIKPNTITFNAIMDAWSRSTQRGGAKKAEKVLTDMENMHKQGVPDIKPDVISYNTVINAWAKTDEEGAAQHAENVLKRMVEAYESGGNDVQPNSRTFNTIISAWSRCKDEGSVQRTEDLLLKMVALSKSGRHDELKPDVVTFTTAMNAWAKSKERGKALKTLDMLYKMQELYKAGNKSCKPNIITYNTVLNACAFSDAQDSKDALKIAVTAFNEIRKLDYANPDSVTYGMFIKVCSNLMPRDDTRLMMLTKVWGMCREEGQVGDLVLAELRRALSPAAFQELTRLSFDGSLEIYDPKKLPLEWTRNVRKGKGLKRKLHGSLDSGVIDKQENPLSRTRRAKEEDIDSLERFREAM